MGRATASAVGSLRTSEGTGGFGPQFCQQCLDLAPAAAPGARQELVAVLRRDVRRQEPRSLYFLAVSTSDGFDLFAGSSDASGPFARRELPGGPGAWESWSASTTPAFRLSATDPEPIPEPATLLLLGSGLGGLAVTARRRRRQQG